MVEKNREKYDFLVIGSGPAGVNAAFQAAKLKKRVAVIEATPGRIGGAWIHTGTIPSKTLREIMDVIYSLRSHIGHQWVDRIVKNISSDRLRNRASEVCLEEENLLRRHLESNNIELIEGYGRIEACDQVRVIQSNGDTSLIETDYIMLATGSKPRRPANIPFDGWRVVDSDEILKLDHLPRSMVIFGAGVIGCEYACIFGALGVKTTIVDARSRIMQMVDQEITEELKRCMEAMGISFKLGNSLQRLETQGSSVSAVFDKETINSDIFFFAAGRESSTRNLGLERVGIVTNERGSIPVNSYFQTKIPNIYAAGDAIGPPALAATSALQGRIASCHAFNISCQTFPEIFPIGVYTIPELSSVGKSEEELRAEGIDYVAGRASFEEVARGYIRGDKAGMVKILADPHTQQILGVHIVGADAANLIHIGQTAMLAKMPLITFVDTMIFNYPTLAESYKIAAFNALNKIFPSGTFSAPDSQREKPTSMKVVA